MGIEINWRLLENKIGIFCLKIVSRYDYIDEWIIKRTFNYMIEDYNYIIWHDISFVLYLTYLRNKYCVSVVIVGGRPFQQFVRPWQLQVTRGNHFFIDLVNLINATDVEADVKLERMLLIYHRANFWGIRVKQSVDQILQIITGLWRHGIDHKTCKTHSYS